MVRNMSGRIDGRPDSVKQARCVQHKRRAQARPGGAACACVNREGDYWPVLGLVPGPGVELGVGLVVLGVSVPMPPALLPDDDAPPDMPDDEGEEGVVVSG